MDEGEFVFHGAGLDASHGHRFAPGVLRRREAVRAVRSARAGDSGVAVYGAVVPGRDPIVARGSKGHESDEGEECG